MSDISVEWDGMYRCLSRRGASGECRIWRYGDMMSDVGIFWTLPINSTNLWIVASTSSLSHVEWYLRVCVGKY